MKLDHLFLLSEHKTMLLIFLFSVSYVKGKIRSRKSCGWGREEVEEEEERGCVCMPYKKTGI